MSNGRTVPEGWVEIMNATETEAALRRLLAAIDMRIHNIDIFVGKWKKGAKAWSGEFVERETREALDALNVVEPEADRSLQGAALRLVAAVAAEGNIQTNCDRDILLLAKHALQSKSEWVWWNKGDGIAVGPRDKGCEAIVFTVEEAQAICRAVNGSRA